ncbi:MAG: glycosyl transferase family 1 [Candidatus Wallbacteria bacterium HGW-Wallbacteria-1]|jgi:ATP-binding cassette subfamily F protein 3|uniref:Glycosyl transferase family 1 n=1 Tax=Candidatus Wallbacteria bacterium HGW-Wallbacteria-1 TaxID=2013854 RepID=A0A2N1PPT7_9BACT|nr:MAG: glycosyl transferase family 1 [Candidatus Wallbacteria bacterium HGW-Wallbacteria-1]
MISISGLTKYMGGEPLYKGASFQIYEGEKIGLIGPNGTGKTTIFRMIVGEMSPDEGSITIQNNTRIAYFSQSVGEMSGRSALQEVMDSNERVSELASRLSSWEEQLCDPDLDPDRMETILNRMGDDQTEFEKLGGYEVESNAQTILTGLGIAPEDHGKSVELFSGGWKMRIALARVLILMPDLILMDEPTNYLDMETILWLEEWLRKFKGAILLTTHDREFMNRVIRKVVEISNGKIRTFTGDYDFYEQEKAILLRNNSAEFSRQQSMLKKEEEFIARFKARASHAAQVQSRIKKIDKIDRVELESEQAEMKIYLPEIPRGGNDVIAIKGLAKSWENPDGTVKSVFAGLDAMVHRRDKIAVVGVNGAGKSTFLKVISNQTEATRGEAVIGASISVGYFGQITIENLNPENTVLNEVRGKLPEATEAGVRNVLASFLFRGEDVNKKIRVLSGGEKARVVLTCLLSVPYNCLILDEPTNHLDLKSRDVLLDALTRYEGTVLFVSHDRYFLRELTTRVFEVDHGKINVYEGDYDYYLESRNSRGN